MFIEKKVKRRVNAYIITFYLSLLNCSKGDKLALCNQHLIVFDVKDNEIKKSICIKQPLSSPFFLYKCTKRSPLNILFCYLFIFLAVGVGIVVQRTLRVHDAN